MAIIQTIPLGKKYGSMTSSEAQAGTNTESQLISAKVLNDQIDEKISDIGLATVATSGSYNDLNDKPAIPTVNNGTLTIQKNGTTVKTFTANSSSNVTADITVPTKVSELTNDSGYITGVSWDNVSGKPSTFTPKAHTHAKSDITNFPALAAVATSGSYTDLSNKPTIPVIDSTLSATSTNGLQNKVIKTALDGKANSSHNHTKSQITDFPTLATVATSGSYNDLTNKPTIPTVNNATLTIQKNGTTVKTFSANASANTTANITVPTKTSDLTNDTDYATRTNVANSLQEAKNYTGLAVANCVNLTGTQTITGTKSIDSGYINLIDSTWDYTDTTNASHARMYRISDKTGMLLGGLQLSQDTSNNRYLSLLIKDGDGANSFVSISSGKKISPSGDNTFSLGLPNRRWANVYATNFTGNLSGNATSATKAVQDASGNVITTTYATKAENSLKANNADVVHTSGNESIYGRKYFDSTNNIISFVKRITDYAIEDTPTKNVYQHLAFQDKNNKNIALVQYSSRTSNVRDLDLYISDASGSLYGIQINTDKQVVPSTNNTYSLGASSAWWNSCYVTNVNASILNIPQNAIVLAFCSSAVNNGSTVAGSTLKVANGGTGGSFTATTETLTGTYRALNTVVANGVGMFVKIA